MLHIPSLYLPAQQQAGLVNMCQVNFTKTQVNQPQAVSFMHSGIQVRPAVA